MVLRQNSDQQRRNSDNLAVLQISEPSAVEDFRGERMPVADKSV
jgi:hypothetical protein